MREGQPALGLTTRMARGAEAVRIARASGHDFVRIDTQHAAFGLETVAQIAQAGLAEHYPTVVRVRGLADPNAAVLLDAGIGGIIFPDIDDATQAAAAVSLTRFPPIGERSYGGSYAHFDYENVAPADAMVQLNQSTLLACMIESRSALENVEHIAAVPGIDVIHLGMSDLLASMGRPGDYDHPSLMSALDRIVSAAANNGILVGCGGAPTVEHQAMVIEHGARFVTTRADANFVIAGAREWLALLKAK
jgi:2-keto-3-deoxy-L-rhamnonate aldolase RhmA